MSHNQDTINHLNVIKERAQKRIDELNEEVRNMSDVDFDRKYPYISKQICEARRVIHDVEYAQSDLLE